MRDRGILSEKRSEISKTRTPVFFKNTEHVLSWCFGWSRVLETHRLLCEVQQLFYAQLMNIRREGLRCEQCWRSKKHTHTHTHAQNAHRKSSNFSLDHCKQTLRFQPLVVMQELYFEGCHVSFGLWPVFALRGNVCMLVCVWPGSKLLHLTTQVVNNVKADNVLVISAVLWVKRCQLLLDDVIQLLIEFTACFPKCNSSWIES